MCDCSIKSFTATSNCNDNTKFVLIALSSPQGSAQSFHFMQYTQEANNVERQDRTCAYPTPRRTFGIRIGARGSSSTAPPVEPVASTSRVGHLNVGQLPFFQLVLSSPLKNLVGGTISSAALNPLAHLSCLHYYKTHFRILIILLF